MDSLKNFLFNKGFFPLYFYINSKSLLQSYAEGLPKLKNWDVNDKSINKVISVDTARTQMQIGSFIGFHIPHPDNNVWSALGLHDKKLKALITLSCTQILWGTVMVELYKQLNTEYTDFSLQETKGTERKIQITQGKLYSLISFDVIDFDTTNLLNRYFVLVRISWSLLRYQMDDLKVLVYSHNKRKCFSRINGDYLWDRRFSIFLDK